MKQLVLGDNSTKYELVSCNIHSEDGVQKSATIVIVIPADSNLTKKKIVSAIESKGLGTVIEGDETIDTFESAFALVLPDVVQNDGEFYLGEDADGTKRYAKASVCLTVLPSAEAEAYIAKLKLDTIERMSATCQKAIEDGLSVQLADGESYPFSYKQVDRENISEMFNAVVFGATAYPYHENDGGCRTFSAADIVTIYSAMAQNKTHHTTYFNQLKQYIKTLTTVSAISEIEYGQELTGEYLTSYNANMAEAQTQLQNILAKLEGGSN